MITKTNTWNVKILLELYEQVFNPHGQTRTSDRVGMVRRPRLTMPIRFGEDTDQGLVISATSTNTFPG